MSLLLYPMSYIRLEAWKPVIAGIRSLSEPAPVRYPEPQHLTIIGICFLRLNQNNPTMWWWSIEILFIFRIGTVTALRRCDDMSMWITNPEPNEQPSRLRRFLPWVGLVVAAAAIYDGAIFYSRWSADRDAERQQKAKEAQDARRFLQIVGGNEVKILTFAAYPPTIRAGQRSNLCYGVSGAKTVELDPAVEEVWPALTHCMMVSPRKTTDYKLTADDGAGHSVSQSVTVQVKH